MGIRIAVIILAAGLGTRMKSDKPKVLHEVAGKPLIGHVMETASKIAGSDIVVVIGNQAQRVKEYVARHFTARFVYQEQQSGTGHAVLCALPALPEKADAVVILCGDVPLIREQTLGKLIVCHGTESRDVTLLAVHMPNPAGYGRIIYDSDKLCGIVEESDATDEQKSICTVNTGIYCVNIHVLHDILPKISRANAQGEMYLTDIIQIGYENGLSLGCMVADAPDEFTGVNTPDDLAKVASIKKNKSLY